MRKVSRFLFLILAVFILTLSYSKKKSQTIAGDDQHEISGMTFVTIPGVTFEMGEKDESLPRFCRPVHKVTLSSFEMSIYEVTNAQYAAYLNAALASGDIVVTSGDVFGKTGDWLGQRYLDIESESNSINKCWIQYNRDTFSVTVGKENWPVVSVSWYGAKAFAEYYGLDLPLEAEWEYACKGGKQYMYGTADGTISNSNANYDKNVGHPTGVGSYPANQFGLYDMSGNVYEWCNDWFGDYSSVSVTNPIGPSSGTQKVVRGGCWGLRVHLCKSAFRLWLSPSGSNGLNGFRVVRRP